jgi:hypothetical protein
MEAQNPLYLEMFERSGQLRTDLIALDRFESQLAKGFDNGTDATKTVEAAIELFWSVLHPHTTTVDGLPATATDLREAIHKSDEVSTALDEIFGLRPESTNEVVSSVRLQRARLAVRLAMVDGSHRDLHECLQELVGWLTRFERDALAGLASKAEWRSSYIRFVTSQLHGEPPRPEEVAEVETKLALRLAELERQIREGLPADLSHDMVKDEGCIDGPVTSRTHTWLYVAAARAYVLKRTAGGYSEDVRDALKRAWHAGHLAQPWPDYEVSLYWVSAQAAIGIVLFELFRIDKSEGKYEDALHSLALGLSYLSTALSALVEPPEDYKLDPDDPLVPLDIKLKHWLGLDDVHGRLREQLGPSPQAAIDVLENLRAHPRDVDWQQVARDCTNIARYWAECFDDGDAHLTDEGGEPVTDVADWYLSWTGFWNQAAGWALAQLTLDQFREYVNTE